MRHPSTEYHLKRNLSKRPHRTDCQRTPTVQFNHIWNEVNKTADRATASQREIPNQQKKLFQKTIKKHLKLTTSIANASICV